MLWWRKVHRRQQPERIEIFTFSGLSLSCLVDTNWLQFQQYFSDSVSSISSVKHSPANAIKISAAILQTVNLLSFSLFDRCDSDKPEKINILLLSGFCLWTLHDHKTFWVIRLRRVNFKSFFFIISRGMSFWVWVFVIPKRRSRKLRLLEVNKKRV